MLSSKCYGANATEQMLRSKCYGANATEQMLRSNSTVERWIGYPERDAQSLTSGDAMVSWV
jgi:hypothetical protein